MKEGIITEPNTTTKEQCEELKKLLGQPSEKKVILFFGESNYHHVNNFIKTELKKK